MLVVDRLTKRFGGFTAVDKSRSSWSAARSSGLIGPNGSGKSTTFNVIAGLFPPTEGTITLDGRSIGGLAPAEVCRAGIARTFQIPRPFKKLSILENATLAAYYGSGDRITRGEAERRAHDALELIGLPRDPKMRLDGLGAAGLKKLEMARALATQPKPAAGRRKPGRAGRRRDEPGRRHAQAHPRRTRHHHHLGRAHHGRADAGDRPVHRARPWRADLATASPPTMAHDPKVVEVYLGTDAECGAAAR
jgi:branched-chain amino acid transport system ATP-binding protein